MKIGLDNLTSSEAEAENQPLIKETNQILAKIQSSKETNYPDNTNQESSSAPSMTFSLVANITTWDEDSYGFRKTQFPQHVDGKPRILHRCRDEAEKILTPNLNGRQSFKANDQSGLLFLKSTPNS